MAYPLPGFVAEVLTQQPLAPRQVSTASISWSVLRGADCSIYAGGGAFFLVIGFIAILSDTGTPSPGVRSSWIGAVLVALGLLCIGFAAFRIWRIRAALTTGEARLAEIALAEVGRARIYGTPWGEPLMVGGMIPISARGTYRIIDTGQTSNYYMQQRWALTLQPGDRIWVVRNNGRDVLYAPQGVRAVPQEARA